MRTLLLMLVLAGAALSGCVSDDSPDDTSTDDPNLDSDADGFTDAQEAAAGTDPADAASQPALPQSLTFTGSMQGVGDASSNAPCAAGEAQCTTIDVPIPDGRWRVTMTLHSHDGMVTSQGVPYGSDYELIAMGQTSTNPGDQAEIIKGTLMGPTSETVEIQAWHDVDGSYELIVEFAFP